MPNYQRQVMLGIVQDLAWHIDHLSSLCSTSENHRLLLELQHHRYPCCYLDQLLRYILLLIRRYLMMPSRLDWCRENNEHTMSMITLIKNTKIQKDNYIYLQGKQSNKRCNGSKDNTKTKLIFRKLKSKAYTCWTAKLFFDTLWHLLLVILGGRYFFLSTSL